MTTRDARPSEPAIGPPSALAASLAVAFAVLLAACGPARAQTDDGYGNAQSIAVGEAELFPSIRIDAFRESNTYLTRDDEIAATGVVVSPAFELRADRRTLELRAGYSGSYARSDEDVLDYTDHSLSAAATTEIGARLRASGSVEFARRHERLGTDLSRLVAPGLSRQNVFDDADLALGLGYGAEGARGNVSFGLGVRSRRYATNAFLTSGNDYVRIVPGAQFSLRLTPRVRGVVEARFRDFAYENDVSDRTETVLLLGANWSVAGATNGTVRVGATRTDPAFAGLESQTELIVELRAFYRPNGFDEISLEFERDIDTLGAVGETLNVEDLLELVWRHRYSSRVFHRATLAAVRNERPCPSQTTLASGAELEVDYAFRRWLSFGVSGSIGTQSGEVCDGALTEEGGEVLEDTYDANRVGLYVRATL